VPLGGTYIRYIIVNQATAFALAFCFQTRVIFLCTNPDLRGMPFFTIPSLCCYQWLADRINTSEFRGKASVRAGRLFCCRLLFHLNRSKSSKSCSCLSFLPHAADQDSDPVLWKILHSRIPPLFFGRSEKAGLDTSPPC
jgi:hypothetical protein